MLHQAAHHTRVHWYPPYNPELEGHFVHTSFHTGLTATLADQCIAILGERAAEPDCGASPQARRAAAVGPDSPSSPTTVMAEHVAEVAPSPQRTTVAGS